jgi:hypothetical protein
MVKPRRHDACDFFCRKKCYALSTLIFCDDRKKILHHYSGWPGSVHDNRIYKHSEIFTKPRRHFSAGEYLLGDSAFMNTDYMVTSFKTPVGQCQLPAGKKAFNYTLSKVRIASEHCIGILKNRFAFLKQIPLIIDKKESRLLVCIRCIEACMVLHNILLEMNNDNDAEAWLPPVDPGEAQGALPNNDTNIAVDVNEQQAETFEDSEPEEEETAGDNNKQIHLYRRFLAEMDMEEELAQLAQV